MIAGGGLAGSVLARRLAESGDGSGSVLVIEAGVDAEDQEVIYSAGAYQQAFDVSLSGDPLQDPERSAY